MRSTIYLHLIFLIIYTCFIYIQISANAKLLSCNFININNQILLILIEGVAVLLGGIAASFIVGADILFAISISCLIGGVTIFAIDVFLNGTSTGCGLHGGTYFLIALILFALFYSLFRMIFLVMILSQGDAIDIRVKIGAWVMNINVAYLIVFLLLPDHIFHHGNIWIGVVLAVVGSVLVVIGKIHNFYSIDSERIDIIELISSLWRPKSILVSDDYESKMIIKSISKSIIIFLLLIPFGICDSQNRYAYQYQSNHMRWPQTNQYLKKSNLWPSILSAVTVIVFLLSLLVLRRIIPNMFLKFFSNIKLRIIIGNVLAIFATLISGTLETIRLGKYWQNSTSMTPSPSSFKQIIGIELLYLQTVKSVKYLSMAFILAATGSGGLSDAFFIIVNLFHIYAEDHLNQRVAKLNSSLCCRKESRLDYVLYGLCAVALLSLSISIVLMQKFYHKFTVCEIKPPTPTDASCNVDNST